MGHLLAEETTCHHCGDPCDESIKSDEYHFCCYGCKAVYELLEQSNLEQYYTETSQENKSLSQIKAERKFAFLDHEDVQNQLLKFKSEEISVIKFYLPGVHCSSCIYLLEHLPKLEPAILRAEVNFVRKEVVISFHHHRKPLKEIAVLLSQLGYPPDISLDSLDKTKNRVAKTNLSSKIAVAGFCFGNAMLMSMPEYLDHNFLLTEDFRTVFNWINLVLAFPVVLYAASDYFSKAWKGIRIANFNIDVPIALGILTLFARSLYEIITSTGPGYVDSLTGLVFFLLVGKWYQGKTYQALAFDRDFTSYFPVSVTCRVGDEEIHRPIRELKKGDVIVIHNDELIPADGVVTAGQGKIDYSFVTGESQPESKTVGQPVFAGGRQKGGELLIEINRSVDNSELTQLWNSDAFQKNQEATLHTWVDRISKYFTLSVILIAIGTGVYWWVVDSSQVWNAVTAVLIVACPCALALVLPFAYGHAMRRLGKGGLYLKNAEVVESLAQIDTIVFDKTGTLTKAGSQVDYTGDVIEGNELSILKSALGNSAHPLSRLLHDELPLCEKLPVNTFEEVSGKGFRAEVCGEIVRVGSDEFLGVSPQRDLNTSNVYIQVGKKKGHFAIKSEYRKGVFDMLENLRRRFRLDLLSGDNASEKERLTPYFDELRFSQKPQDKLRYLEAPNGKTLMVGDGLNDAGALKKATVGIAVSEDIHQFSPACDAIFGSEAMASLPGILTMARKTVRVVFIAFGVSFLYNIIGLSFAVAGKLTPLISAILMPVSSVTVVGLVTLLVGWAGRKTLGQHH